MKRLMVILAILCSSAHMFASELVVKGKIDVPFSVFINGEKYYSYNNKVNVGYIPSGVYKMEIYTEGRYYELLYDYSINIPRHSTVYATFTGDNKMYISTERDAPAVVIDLTPYPRRYHAPRPHYVAPVYHYHSTPKVVHHHHHHAAPKAAPAHHHSSPKVASSHKPAPKASPAPKTSSSRASAPKSTSSTRSTSTASSRDSKSHTSRSTVATRN